MGTVLGLEQGGTGVQSVAALKQLMSLGDASQANISHSYTDDNKNTVPSSYALSEGIKNAFGSSSGVLPISKGGTGATTPEQARQNLGITGTGGGSNIEIPVSIENGGTGGSTAEEALTNLGIPLPIAIENGGTGATTSEQALNNLGIGFPIPIENGGTGVQTIDALRQLMGIQSLPLPISQGGTGANTATGALLNLGILLPLPVLTGGTGANNAADARKNLGITGEHTISSSAPVGGVDGDVWFQYIDE